MKKKSRYLILNEGCYVIHGACRSAIYDLIEGNVYSIQKWLALLLDNCGRMGTNSMKLEAIKMGVNPREVEESFDFLKSIGLARFHEKPIYPYKIKSFYSRNEYQLKMEGIRLFSLTCEIFSGCNLNCLHCKENSIPLSNCTCRKNINNNSINVTDWKRIISDGALFGCKKIRFMGGEPLLYKEELISLLEYSYEVGYNQIDLFTNGTLIDEEFIEKALSINVRVFIPIYSNLPQLHDNISGVQGSFTRTIENVNILIKKSIKTSLYVLIFRQNFHTLESTIRFIRTFHVPYTIEPAKPIIGKNHVIYKNHEILSDEVLELSQRKEPNFDSISLDNFILNQKWNSCWKFQVAVTNSGDFIPCIRARNKIIGNIKDITLQDLLLEERLKPYWSLSKDKIEVCKDCEYRYVCSDCRISASTLEGEKENKPPFCGYDPYHGIWTTKSNLLISRRGLIRGSK